MMIGGDGSPAGRRRGRAWRTPPPPGRAPARRAVPARAALHVAEATWNVEWGNGFLGFSSDDRVSIMKLSYLPRRRTFGEPFPPRSDPVFWYPPRPLQPVRRTLLRCASRPPTLPPSARSSFMVHVPRVFLASPKGKENIRCTPPLFGRQGYLRPFFLVVLLSSFQRL